MGKNQNAPSAYTQLIQPIWPLHRWGMDMIGPLPTAQGNLKYVVVAVDYFTKWIEAKALITITSQTIQKFFWQNIICRFGVPMILTVDNGTQFDAASFREFCDSKPKEKQQGTKMKVTISYVLNESERVTGVLSPQLPFILGS